MSGLLKNWLYPSETPIRLGKGMLIFGILAISSILLLGSCNKKTEPLLNTNGNPVAAPTTVLLLKVDFMKRVFEGGTEISLSQHHYTKDSIPVKVDFYPPGDFGYIKLFYFPTNDLLFNGSIIRMGSEKITYPAAFDTATKFKNLNYTIHKPDSSRFQKIFTIPTPLNDTIPWSAINNLEVVKNYLAARKK